MFLDELKLENTIKDIWNKLVKIYLKSALSRNEFGNIDDLDNEFNNIIFSIAQAVVFLMKINQYDDDIKYIEDYIVDFEETLRIDNFTYYLNFEDINTNKSEYTEDLYNASISRSLSFGSLIVNYNENNKDFLEMSMEDYNEDSDLCSSYKYVYDISEFDTQIHAYINLITALDILINGFDRLYDTHDDILSYMNDYDNYINNGNGLEVANNEQIMNVYHDYVHLKFLLYSNYIEAYNIWSKLIIPLISNQHYIYQTTIQSLTHGIIDIIIKAICLFINKNGGKEYIDQINRLIASKYKYDESIENRKENFRQSITIYNLEYINKINYDIYQAFSKELNFKTIFTFFTHHTDFDNIEIKNLDVNYKYNFLTKYYMYDTGGYSKELILQTYSNICITLINDIDKFIKTTIGNTDLSKVFGKDLLSVLDTLIRNEINKKLSFFKLDYIDRVNKYNYIKSDYNENEEEENYSKELLNKVITNPQPIIVNPNSDITTTISDVFNTILDKMSTVHVPSENNTDIDTTKLDNKNKIDVFDQYIDCVSKNFIPKISNFIDYNKYKVRSMINLLSELSDMQYTDLIEKCSMDDYLDYKMVESCEDIIIYIISKHGNIYRLLLSDDIDNERKYNAILLNDFQISEKLSSIDKSMKSSLNDGEYKIVYLYKYGYSHFKINYSGESSDILYFSIELLQAILSKALIDYRREMKKYPNMKSDDYGTSSKWNEASVISTLENVKNKLSNKDIDNIISLLNSLFDDSNKELYDVPKDKDCIVLNVNSNTILCSDNINRYIINKHNDNSYIDKQDKNIYIRKIHDNKESNILTIHDVRKNESNKIDFIIKTLKYIKTL